MVKSQQQYGEAQRLWNYVQEQRWTKITTNWTLYEAVTILNGKNVRRHDLALELLQLARRTTTIVDALAYETEALQIFTRHSDKRWSVVDCASFACIRERQAEFALSFDGDFAQAQGEFGFILFPPGAST